MSETSINPNVNMTTTDTTVDGKIEVNSGSGPFSFDELDQLTAKSKRAKSEKSTEDKDVKDDKSESKNEKSIDLSSDDDKGKSEKDTKEKSADKESEQKKEANEAKLRKLIKAKLADKEVELDEETLVPVLINGKEEMWTLKELRADKAGKTAWDKQFTELSKQKKAQSTQELKLRQAAESVKSVFAEEDPDLRMYRMAQMAGVDPVQYRTKFLNENINLLEKWNLMDENERKADALAYENKYNKHRADTLEGSIKQEQSQKELSAKLESLRASHQVSEDEFVSQYDQISQMIASGDLDKSKATPEFIIETIQKDRLWNAIDTSLQNLNLPWSPEERGKKILAFVDDAHHLGLKPEDMAEMVDEIWGQKKAQKKVQQIQNDRQEFLSGKKEVAQNTKPKHEAPIFFDEM